MAALAKFARLPLSRKLLVLRSALTLLAVKAGLMTLGFSAVRRITSKSPRPGASPGIGRAKASAHSQALEPTPEAIAWAVEAAGIRIPGGRNCLTRALATEYLLHRYGYACELKIGVRREEGKFAAHAWLESDQRVIIGEFEIDSYVPLAVAQPRPIEPRQ